MRIPRIADALGLIDEKHISEAMNYRRKKSSRVRLKYGALAACLVLIIGIAAFAVRESRIPVRPDPDNTAPPIVTEPTGTTSADVSTPTATEPPVTEPPTNDEPIVSTKGTEEMPNPSGKTGYGTGGDEMRLFYEPCVPIFEGVPLELYRLRSEEEVKAWSDSYVNITIQAADSIAGYANLYSFITDLGISKDEAEEALEYYLATDDWQINISREGFDNIFTGDIATVTKEFATEYSIVVGNKIYSPFWVYSHSIEDYEAVGITKEDISKMLGHINAFYLSDEAREAFETKLHEFINHG